VRLVWFGKKDGSLLLAGNTPNMYVAMRILVVGGRRLPSVEELRSLVDHSQSDPALPEGHPFGSDISTAYHWSSTTCVADTSQAWVVSFFNGGVYDRDKLDSHVFRAVRSGQ
jgi:hypothetical protein